MQFGIQYQKGIHSTKQIQSRVRIVWSALKGKWYRKAASVRQAAVT